MATAIMNTTTGIVYARGISGALTLTGTGTQILNVNGTAALPSFSFASDPDTGIFRSASGQVDIAINGNDDFRFSSSGFQMGDVILSREATGHLFQRNSTNAQRASWANTYTSATNYEAFSVDWQTTANVALVGTRTAATGSIRELRLVSQAQNAVDNYAAVSINRSGSPISVGLVTAAGTWNQSTGTQGSFLQLARLTSTAVGGSNAIVAIEPTYNQTSGTAANTDLLINRTETAVGSGAQRLLALQVGSADRFSVNNAGQALSYGPTAGIGYGTGAGGAVTQGAGSGKATGVELNTVTGQITMDNAALNAGVEVSFVVTNSAVAATDVVIVNHASVGTAGAYLVGIAAVASGSFTVTVANLSASNLSEAIVLNFAILKGVAA